MPDLSDIASISLEITTLLADAVEKGSPDPRLLLIGEDRRVLNRLRGANHGTNVGGGERDVRGGRCVFHACIIAGIRVNARVGRGKRVN